MTINRELEYRKMASRGKYRRLYNHLQSRPRREWQTTFQEIENILGFQLPPSARLHRPWWSNQRNGNGHSQALAWNAAGWDTANVNLQSEMLSLKPKEPEDEPKRPTLDEILPPRSVGEWIDVPKFRREELYSDRL